MRKIAATFQAACQAKKHCGRSFYTYIIGVLRLHNWPPQTTRSSAAQHGQISHETLQCERIIKKLVLKRHSTSDRYWAHGNCWWMYCFYLHIY